MTLWYDIWINGDIWMQNLKSGDFLFEEDLVMVLLEGGSEYIKLKKEDKIEVRCK